MHLHDSVDIMSKTSEIKTANYRKKVYIFYSIYIIINTLIVYKYGTRQNYIDAWVLATGYSLFLLMVLFLNLKCRLKENTYKLFFFIGSSLFLLFSIWLNIHVDKFSLQVDRWSAMEACIKALLHNEYPYSAIDHLQGRSSNLPALIFIGIPFYLLGDVGYLQSFTFIIFLLLICNFFKPYRVRFWALMTIIFSSAYCYDIYVKSDIISNSILTLAFVTLSEKFYKKDRKKDILFNGIGSAILIMTRIVTVIPLIVLLLKRFFKMSFKNKGLFTGIFLFIVILSFVIVFRNVDSVDNFMKFNPFYLQNSQMPFFLSLLCIILSIVYALFIDNLEGIIRACTLILLVTVLLSLIAKTVEFNGFYNSILNSRFDISYFNFVNPFLIFYLALLFNKCSPTEFKH